MPRKRSSPVPAAAKPASPSPPKGGGRGEGQSASPLNKSEIRPGGGGQRGVRPSALLDTRIIYCGDCLDQLRKLPDACVDLIYIDPPFNSNRNYEVFWGEPSEPRAQASGFLAHLEDRHASTQAYIEYMRPRCVELARVLKKTGSKPLREGTHRSPAACSPGI